MTVRCSNGVAFLVLAPAPSVRTGIRVEIYDGANPSNLLAYLPDTFARKWTEPLRGAGSGSFRVFPDNPALVDDPTLLDYGNVAVFVVDEVPRFAITIEHKSRVEVTADGEAAQAFDISGRGVLAKLEDAQTYPAGGISGDPIRAFASTNAGAAMKTLVDEAQARGALVGVTYDFDETTDSNNAPFSVPLTVEERAGTDLLRISERHGSAWVDVRMTPALVLQYFNQRGIDRSLQLVNAGPVDFLPGKNVVELERSEDGAIRNTLLIETPTGYVERTEGASITAHSRREAFLSLGNISDSDAIDRASTSVFQASAEPAAQIGFEVLDLDGIRPWVDWDVGDWVRAPDESGDLTRYRVRGLTVDETAEGRARFIPELSTITEELEERLERWLSAMARGTLGGHAAGVAEPVKAPAEVVDAITDGVAEHVATQPHFDELADLADVDLTGLTDGDLLQYDSAVPGWVPLPGASEGDMLYLDSSGVWVVVGGSKADGKAPMIQASGAVQWETPPAGGGGGGGGEDLALAKPVTYSSAPSGSYPEYPVNRLLDADSDWGDSADGSLLGTPWPGIEDFSQGFVGLAGAASTTWALVLDLDQAETGSLARIWGMHGSDVIYRPVAIKLEVDDADSSSFSSPTTVKSWTGLTDGGQPGRQGWMAEVDVSGVGAKRYWRWTLTRRSSGGTWLFLGHLQFLP